MKNTNLHDEVLIEERVFQISNLEILHDDVPRVREWRSFSIKGDY